MRDVRVMIRLKFRRLTCAFVFASVVASSAFAASTQDWLDCKASDPDRSIEGCTRVVQATDETPATLANAYSNRGMALAGKRNYDGAIEDFSTAIRLDTQQASFYYNRGVVYGRKGDYDHAVADYSSAIALDPKKGAAYHHRAFAYFKLGKTSDALPDANRAVELNPDDQYAYNIRAHLHEVLNQRDEAIVDYNKALAINPESREAKDGLMRLGLSQ
jgi:tetratricopeptide (TPR) repeat protein